MSLPHRVPDFLYIGPDKSGSSWLFEVLRQHPRCFVPPAKDLYFFDRHYSRGMGWYLRHFSVAPAGCTHCGELSHDYLFSAEAAARIARDLPAARLVTILREPAERTFSHYLYLLRSGHMRLAFPEALDAFPELTRNSLYGQHLAAWLRVVDRRQLGVFFFDQLQSAPEALGAGILDFIGLPTEAGIDFHKRVLPAAAPRSAPLAGLAKAGANLARGLGFPNLVGRVKRGPASTLLYRPYAEGERPMLRPEWRARLQERFAEDRVLLRGILGGEGPAWLTREAAT